MSVISSYVELTDGDTDPAAPTVAGRGRYYVKSDQLYFWKTGAGSPIALLGASTSTLMIAGAGLTGGGDLSTNRTFNVVANADNTIVVNPDDIQVGVLIAANLPTGIITSAKIADGTVANVDLANMAASTVKGQPVGSSGAPVDMTPAQTKTLLAIASTDVSGLGTLATLSAVGSAQITDGSVANVDLASMSSATFKGQTLGGSGAPVDLTPAQAKTALAIASGDVSGLGSLATLSAVGSAQITDGSVANVDLASMSSATFKGQTLGGSGAPVDLTPAQAKTALAIAAGDVSGLGSLATLSAVGSAQITDGSVANVDLATMAAFTFKGNNTAATASPTDVTLAALVSALNSGIANRAIVADVALAASTAEQVIAAYTVAANTILAQDSYRIRAEGSSTVTAASVIATVRVRVGAVGSGTGGLIAAQAAMTCAATARTTNGWTYDAIVTVRTNGASGTIIGGINIGGPFYSAPIVAGNISAVLTAVAIDTTQARDIVLTVQYSATTQTANRVGVCVIDKV